ncbi:hypothetical protein Q5752_004359 [Cryptotrichosporon argae]
MRPPLLLLGLLRLVSASQLPFTHDAAQPEAAASLPASAAFAESLVSLLSASSEHGTFLHLLQRAKAVPMLAHMAGGTVFAPTDAAWADWAARHRPALGLWAGWLGPGGLDEWLMSEDDVRARGEGDDEAAQMMDNQNWALRQHLLYHMLNYTLAPRDLYVHPAAASFAPSDAESGLKPKPRRNVSIETTLLYPLAAEPALPPTPPPGPPWLPCGGHGLLGGHGQRMRLARAGSDEGGARGKVGVDWKGADGVAVWNGQGWNVTNATEGMEGTRWARNGVVVGIDGVLDPPGSVEDVIRTTPELAYLARLLDADALPRPIPSLADSSNLTVFAPADAAWDSLDDIEKHYLEGGYGAEGVARIVGPGIIEDKRRVWWSDELGDGANLSTVVSGNLSITAADGGLVVNGTPAEVIDIFASNGVVHVVPNLLVPPDFALLNSVEKVLLSVNATRFVSLLQSANLSGTYLAGSDRAYTILAPTDDVIDSLERRGAAWPTAQFWRDWSAWLGLGADELSAVATPGLDNAKPIPDASPLAALLQYHILPGKLAPVDIKDGMLVGTELRTSALGGARQRLRVDVSQRLGARGDSQVAKGEIRFGDASIMGPPLVSGKSIIYLVSSLLSPPLDVLQTAVSNLELSTYVAAVYAADLDRAVKRSPATTYLMPINAAFASLGLGMKYLLLPEGKDELRRVLRYHALDGVVYAADVEEGKNVFKSVEGGDVVVERRGKRSNATRLWARSPTKWPGHDSGEPGLPANGELRPAQVTHGDALTETGAVHTLNRVVLPADVHLSVAKLIRGSKQTTMAELMVRAGLGWILDGREPSAQEVARAGLGGAVRAYDDDDNDDSGAGKAPMPPEKAGSLAFPAYTVLVPTDKAFARADVNLTAYLDDPDRLLALLKLHIVPTQPVGARAGAGAGSWTALPPEDGMPLALTDDAVFATLLSASSKYGDIAVRSTGDAGYILGVRNARAGSSGDAARTGAAGRAGVRWRHPTEADLDTSLGAARHGGKSANRDDDAGGAPDAELWSGGMTLGGGVIVIDTVLVPYEPSWLSTWGPLVIIASAALVLVLIAAASWGWWYTTRSKEYAPLEGEDDE